MPQAADFYIYLVLLFSIVFMLLKEEFGFITELKQFTCTAFKILLLSEKKKP